MEYDFNDKWIKEGIVRALLVKEASGIANAPLFEEYNRTAKSEENSSYLWAIGNTICGIAKPDDLQHILNIVNDRNNGTSRQIFVMALGRFKNYPVTETLINLLDDNDVQLHAINSLGRLKLPETIPAIEPYLNHTRSEIRKEARNAIAKINKAQKN